MQPVGVPQRNISCEKVDATKAGSLQVRYETRASPVDSTWQGTSASGPMKHSDWCPDGRVLGTVDVVTTRL
jgi:hypothetical protein